jgi:hypothetical protein
MIWWQALILLGAGVAIAVGCVLVGGWIVFKAKSSPGTGEGFLRDPKGDVFSIPDEMFAQTPPGTGEPSKDEETILKNTNRFLQALGGER